MEPKLSAAQAVVHQAGDVVSLAPQDWTDAKEALSKLAHAASDQRRHAPGSDFFAGPRITDTSLDAALHRAGANDDRPSAGKRTSRRFARFLAAACLGAALTLAWQSYGGTAEQMIANAAPQLSWLMPRPAMNAPSSADGAVEQPTTPPVAPAPTPASAEATAVTAPGEPTLDQRQLETLSHDLAIVRDNLAQLGAGQEQIARDIAKLQTDAQDIRRRISAYPAAIPARKPVPPPQPAPPPPQLSAAPPVPPPPAPQSSAASIPQGTAQSSSAPTPTAPEPPRPPMPVR